MKLYFLLFILFLSSLYATQSHSQQTGTVTGLITNQAALPMPEASICILNASDSILVNYTYSQASGRFGFKALPYGDYLLLISYSDYADFASHFSITADNPSYTFDTVRISRKAIILEEVMIKARKEVMKMNGDTIEYDAGAITIQPNDKVEDLLKRLPGIQVDRDGKITAQGQVVTKVLVDGEEFFADDPKLVTRNLRADMVDKIQVFDKTTDQATFTGIDDGVRSRTINVKLKEDKKNGLFGKVSAGAGTDGYYHAKGMFNRFKKQQKFSAYGTMANNGGTGLSDDDFGSIGSSGINLPNRGLVTTSSIDDQLETYEGTYDGRGFPRAQNGGVHYDTKWNEGQQSINTNYQLGSISVNGNSTGLVQQNLAEGTLNNVTQENFDNRSQKQKLNAIYKYTAGKSSELKIDLTTGTEKFDVINDYHSSTTDASGNIVNDQKRSVTNQGDLQAINLDSYYARKFKKERRTLAWSMSGNFNNGSTHGFLRSETSFSNVDSTGITDQLKTSDIKNVSLKSEIVYSEPLSKNISLHLKYGVAMDNSKADRKSFNRIDGPGYTELDTLFSNNYKFRQFGNTGGVHLKYSHKNKIYSNIGTDATAVTFRQDDLYSLIRYKRTFLNWSPFFNQSFYWKDSDISASYRGSNSQPTLEQIQPVLNNTDPLNIRLGNPGLKPWFSNRFEIYYRNRNSLSGKYTYVRFDYNFTQNAISSDVSTDISTGQTIFRYVNLSRQMPYNYRAYIDFSRRISDTDIFLSLGISTTRNVSYNFINGALNNASFGSYGGSISASWRIKKRFDVYLAFRPDYTINRLSLQPQYDNNAKGFSSTGNLRIFLPAKMQIDSDIDYSSRGKTAVFQDFQRVMWNASVSKKLLKSNNLKFSISGYDLLNQNQRFDRSVAGNTFRQQTSAVIRRYFMFSLSWDFTRFRTLPSSTTKP